MMDSFVNVQLFGSLDRIIQNIFKHSMRIIGFGAGILFVSVSWILTLRFLHEQTLFLNLIPIKVIHVPLT